MNSLRQRAKTLAIPWLILSAAAVSGCGGGSSTGGATSPAAQISGNVLAPATGPGDAQQYFPAAASDEWYYNATTDNPAAAARTSLATLTVGGTKVVNGLTASVFTLYDSALAAGTDSYYVVSPGGVSLVGSNDATDTVTQLVTPYATLLFPVQTGTVSSLRGTNLSAGKDAAGNPITLDATQTIQNIGVETVSVPAGTFPNAMKQTTAASVTERSGGQTATANGTATSWIVPGVGVVKETSVASGPGSTVNTTHDLRGYVLGGVRHGVGGQHTAHSEIAPNPSQFVTRSPAVLGSTGSAFALVYPQVAGTPSHYTISWTAHPINLDGTSGVPVTISPASPYAGAAQIPAIASDGANYLVALQQPNAMQQPVISVSRWVPGTLGYSPLTVVTPVDATSPALGFDGTQYLLVYDVSLAPLMGHLFGQFINAQTGQASGAALPLTTSGSGKAGPAVAFDGQNYLVVWFDSAGPAGTLAVPGYYATRVTPAGVVLDTTPILIAQQNAAGPTYTPVVAFDGSNYLVAYPDNRSTTLGEVTTLSATRVSRSGVVLDGTSSTPGIVVATSANTINAGLSLAFIAGQYWLSWVSSQDNGTIVEDGLYLARISTAGAVISPGGSGFRLAPASTDSAPTLAGGAGGGMAAWTATVPSAGDAIRCATVDAAGP